MWLFVTVTGFVIRKTDTMKTQHYTFRAIYEQYINLD